MTIRFGNWKKIDGEEFKEILDHNHHVIGYVKDERTFNKIVLSTDCVKGMDREIFQWEDKYGQLHYEMTHPRKKKSG